MTSPPTLQPDELHDLLAGSVAGFEPASPQIGPLQRRATRRRRRIVGGSAAVAAALVTAAIVVPLVIAGRGSRESVSQVHRPPPAVHHAPQPSHLSPSGRRQHRQQVAACRRAANAHTFLMAERAVVDSSGAVTITGHQGYETCGGPSDISYGWHNATESFTVAPSATVRQVHSGNAGPAERTIALTALPSYLQHDTNTRFFQYAGPSTGITRLVELYHP